MAKIMVIVGFLVAFAAGLTVGLELRRPSVAQVPTVEPTTRSTTGPTTRGSRSPGGWFASQLNLTPEQREQMDAIWSDLARSGRREMDRRRDELREQRDAAIVELLGPDNKPEYAAILERYEEQHRDLFREMRSRFERAVEQTNALLTPEQQAKYKELLARHRPPERGGPGGPGKPDRVIRHREIRRDDGGATPATQAQP